MYTKTEVLRRCTSPEGKQTVESKGWEVVCKSRLDVESGTLLSRAALQLPVFLIGPLSSPTLAVVMVMAAFKDSSFALTVLADHLI